MTIKEDANQTCSDFRSATLDDLCDNCGEHRQEHDYANQTTAIPSGEGARKASPVLDAAPPVSRDDDGPTVHDVTVRVCQACIDLVGEECHTPACVFCFHGMSEVKWLLDKMLICPIIDGERIVLAGDNVPTELPTYLECAMCSASEAFVISKQDPSTGYCFAEKREWTLKAARNYWTMF